MKVLAKIITATTVVITTTEGVFQADKSNPRFAEIAQLVREDRGEEAVKLVNLKSQVTQWSQGTDLSLRGNDLYYQGEIVSGLLAERIVELIRLGQSADSLVAFLKNLMENPSKRSVDELYGFLESSKLPITDDGHFLAYKAVRKNYTDIHSGKFNNAVGAVCKMPRNKVDDNKDRTCSAGLHFAAYEYANSFGGYDSRMMIVKINPKDVVSIPSDYNNQKGRCCEYTVIQEVERGDNSYTGKAVVLTAKPVTKTFSALTLDDTDLTLGDTYDGTAEDFPCNRDAQWDLYRASNRKQYEDYFFVEYNDKGHLIFRKHTGVKWEYITVADIDDWSIILTREFNDR